MKQFNKKNQCVKMLCDLCGRENTDPGFPEQWSNDGRLIEFVDTMSYRADTFYGDVEEGGQGTHYEIDMCPTCFKERLIPWIESQGGHVQVKEVEL